MIGSKVVNGWILPSGGVSSRRVSYQQSYPIESVSMFLNPFPPPQKKTTVSALGDFPLFFLDH